MKRTLCAITAFLMISACWAERPAWTYQAPKAGNRTYLYKVTRGVGVDATEARNDALVQMIQIAITIEGVEVESNEIFRAVQSRISFEALQSKYRLPMNECCSYPTKEGKDYVCYLLYQVPNNIDLNGEPEFQHFDECNVMPKNPYIGYSFVPGMAQIKKGSTAKGVCFIAGEIVFAGGIVVSECLRQSYINKINSTHNTQLRMQYTKDANACGIARNISIAGVAAVYVWNVIDGIVAKGPAQYAWGETEMRFAPYTDFESVGLAFQCNF